MDESLPNLSDEAPITLRAPSGILSDLVCRYCDLQLSSRRDLYRHHTDLAGSCQVQNKAQLPAYLSILSEVFEMHECRYTGCHLEFDIPANSSGIQYFPDMMDFNSFGNISASGSSIPPALLYWTKAEKERFFYALVRCSRLRPDLIAEHVGTKSTAEVLAFQLALEAGTPHLGDTATTQTSHPVAREMSDRWISFEEKMAEDAIIWEAFTASASAIPWHQRDYAQAAAINSPITVHCTRCRRGTCDGLWPTCGQCQIRCKPCKWPEDFHPCLLPETEHG